MVKHSLRRLLTPQYPQLVLYGLAAICGTVVSLSFPSFFPTLSHTDAISIAGGVAILSVLFAFFLRRHPLPLSFLSLFAITLFFFIRTAIVSIPRFQAINTFTDLAGEEGVTIRGELFGVRRPFMTDGGMAYRFSLKNATYRTSGEEEILMDPVSVLWFVSDHDNVHFEPKAEMQMEFRGDLYTGRYADPVEPSLSDIYLVTSARESRLLGKKLMMETPLSHFRDKAADNIVMGLENRPEERDMLLAMLLGFRSDLPQDLIRAFRRAGTIHIFAISGLHVGAIAILMVFFLTLVGVSHRYVVLPLIPLLAAYIYMTDMQPSAMRAGVMIIAYYSANLFLRRPSGLVSVSFAVLILLLIDPLQIRELGFILSFSMVTGIILFTDRIRKILYRLFRIPQRMRERNLAIIAENTGDPNARVDRWPRDGLIIFSYYFINLFSGALTAALVSFPLTTYFFGVITPYAILANIVVVPLALPVMAIAGVSLFFGMLHPTAAILCNQCAALLAGLMKAVSKYVAFIPGAVIYREFPLWALVAWYVLLALFLRWLTPKSEPEDLESHREDPLQD